MFIDYLSCFKNALKESEDFKKHIITVYFNEGRKKEYPVSHFCFSPTYQKYFMPIKKCVELSRILKIPSFERYDSDLYEIMLDLEDAQEVKDLENFILTVDVLIAEFGVAKNEIDAFCSAFDVEEKERINEAIHNHLEGCNYSCVAMSVSAIESRLLKLMRLACPDSEQELEKKTLGQLIVEYIDNKSKYKDIVPREHENLLGLCNTYRTFSVHPKKRKIKATTASAIFQLAIDFLTDPNTKPEIIEAGLTASEEVK